MGNGPWNWPRARYTLLDGGLSQHTLTYSRSSISSLRALGCTTRETDDEERGPVSFSFDGSDGGSIRGDDIDEGGRTLSLSLPSFEEAGVGAKVWDSAIALTLLQRSDLAPELPARPSVLELGAGVGLPGLDFARRVSGATVTLSDARPKLLEVLRWNADRCVPRPKDVSVRGLEWGKIGPINRLAKLDSVTGTTEAASSTGEAGEAAEAGARARASSGSYDLIMGSDIAYDEDNIEPLVELLTGPRGAPVSLIVGPATRPSMQKLAERLGESAAAAAEAGGGLRLEQRLVTLVVDEVVSKPAAGGRACGGEGGADGVRSGGVHLVLVVRRALATAA